MKTRLNKWGYYKNLKRGEVASLLHQVYSAQSIGERPLLVLRQRPVDLERVEKHRKRAKLQTPQGLQSTVALGHLARAEHHQVIPSSFTPKHLKATEKLFHNVDSLIKSSFETRCWRFHTNEQLILSSPNEDVEKINLQEFVADIDSAKALARSGRVVDAGLSWRRAFGCVNGLVKAQYHDIIPNLVQKINDLNNDGYHEIAGMLKKHIADMARTTPSAQTSSALVSFDALELTLFNEIEENIMTQFNHLFHFYLGATCYSSFVMKMNAARRQLAQKQWQSCESVLPDLELLDASFGASNRRSMDVVSLRLEVGYRRVQYAAVQVDAGMLIHRAAMIENDDWLAYYYLTRGYYFLGSAQFHLGEKQEAEETFACALAADHKLCLIKDFSIFNAEKVMMRRYLEDIHSKCETA
tara:strand:- start:1874 stop:3109 length:1236 start_codon:yes stop_codon:yes gene_type:complete